MNLLELHEKPSIFKITPHVATIAILCFIVLTITSFMLINQIIKCKKYKIKYRNLFETLRNLQYRLLELDFNYDDHTRPIEEYIKTTQKMKNIQKIYNKAKQCKLILKLTSSILIMSIIYIIINNHTNVKNAFISDIKNNITINNDQLIVNKLPSNYHYTNKKLDENKQESFKMMHKDSEIILIDKNQNEYRVQQEDYNNIKKKITKGNKNMFEEYKNTLSKQQVKLFDKVVKLYKELRPYYYDEVISNIDKLKISEKSKNEMFKFNEYIYSNFFKSGEFLKEYGDFKIGDKIYSDLTSKECTIKEFSTYENCVYIIKNDYNFALPTPLLIETVKHDKRNNKGESIYSKLQKEDFHKNLNITKINSRLSSFLEYYLTGQIDFNPEYQRELVWTTEQKENYIKALIQDKAEITPTFITKPYKENDYLYEVLDGKQRLNAILSYIKGEFSIDGIYYKDLTQADVHKFLRTPYNYTVITYINEKGENPMPKNMKIELFLQINEYGTKISQEELTRIKNSTGDKERNI